MTISQKLKERFSKIRENEALKNHGTFRVGGPADFFYELTEMQDLAPLIDLFVSNGIPYRMIGRGTNILFTDKGYRGCIIKNLTKNFSVEGTRIRCESGVLLSQIIKASVEQGLAGLEPLAGLPGSIGGAIWGNAGVPGTEISFFLKNIMVLRPGQGTRTIEREEMEFRYRYSSLQQAPDLICEATLELAYGNREASKADIRNRDAARRAKQPSGFSAGSFFKNPSPDAPAGILLQKAGMKGAAQGGAKISEKHANFFMNVGMASAADLLELAKKARRAVQAMSGIELEMEVKIIGDL